jgi:hypothetical protein
LRGVSVPNVRRLSGEFGKAIREKLAANAARLETGKLDQDSILPPKHPFFFPKDRTAKLQTLLDEVTLRTSIATLVFERGWKRIVPTPPSDKRTNALKNLEELALAGDELQAAAKRLQEIITAFEQPDAADGARAPGNPVELISQESIERGFVAVNLLGWAIWGLLTILGGFYVLILDKTGFGLLQDYILTFFWGVGLPAAADKLTPAAIMQTLRAGTPKPS